MSNNSSSDEELESIRSFDSYEQANRTEHNPVTINNLNSNVVSEGVTSAGLNEDDSGDDRYIPNTLYDTYSNDSEGKLQKVETETADTLRKRLSRKVTLPNTLNYPEVGNNYSPIFPENYTIETRTGLVPIQSLHGLGRSTTNVSLPSSTGAGGLLRRTETIPATLQDSKLFLTMTLSLSPSKSTILKTH